MSLFNKLDFVRNEISEIKDIKQKPKGGLSTFSSRIRYAISLGFKEKEIFIFGLLQWASIGIGYILWVQMLDWIPESVWRSAARSDDISSADIILFAWSFVCVGIAAFPVGIFTGCMGAAHFLHRRGEESTVATCLKLVLPQSWPLWLFHWIDGWITVSQIVDRLPRKNDTRSSAQIALGEAMYYAWKLGVSGVLPSIVTGNGLIASGKNSIKFVKNNFSEIKKLRAGYSILCWMVGIGAYIGTIILFITFDVIPEGDEVYSNMYAIYLWAAVPILVAVGFVMLLLRPIYVLTLCDLYADYLEENNIKPPLPDKASLPVSVFVSFSILCLLVLTVFLFCNEIGVIDMLSSSNQ